MKTVTGTKLLIVLVGIGTAVMVTVRAVSPAKTGKCTSTIALIFGRDHPGCETEPTHISKAELKKWLHEHHIPRECYKVRFWKNKHPDTADGTPAEEGGLDELTCDNETKGKVPSKMATMQPSGNHVTQRVLLRSAASQSELMKKIKSSGL